MYKHIPVFVAACFSMAALADEGAAKISPLETAKAAAANTFETLDKNADGRISRTEAGMDKSLSNIFATADTDGDGYVSKAEYAARPQG